MLELEGKYDSFGISWSLYDYGVCPECGGEIVMVEYPKGFAGGGNRILYITEIDFLCPNCGTSATERKKEEIGYDKNKLMLEINSKIIEFNPENWENWWVKNSYKLG